MITPTVKHQDRLLLASSIRPRTTLHYNSTQLYCANFKLYKSNIHIALIVLVQQPWEDAVIISNNLINSNHDWWIFPASCLDCRHEAGWVHGFMLCKAWILTLHSAASAEIHIHQTRLHFPTLQPFSFGERVCCSLTFMLLADTSGTWCGLIPLTTVVKGDSLSASSSLSSLHIQLSNQWDAAGHTTDGRTFTEASWLADWKRH